jgi:hypothetical protein
MCPFRFGMGRNDTHGILTDKIPLVVTNCGDNSIAHGGNGSYISYMDAYGEGYAAFHRGVDRDLNPWAEGLREYRQWFRGWDDAARASQR